MSRSKPIDSSEFEKEDAQKMCQGCSTVNLGFDPEEIGTKLKFGTELLWVVPNNISKILSNPLWGKKVTGGHVFCKAYFMKKLYRKQV